MKISAFYFLIVAAALHVSCMTGYSQLQFFLPDSNACFSVSPYKFWFNGDTTIGTAVYKKVFLQQHDSTADFSRAGYYAAVREDTAAGRIYCVMPGDGTERLLADFSLRVGDTLTVHTFFPAPRDTKITIGAKDSTDISGRYRNRLGIDWAAGTEYWIEGIGSTNGLFYPGAQDAVYEMDVPVLLCVTVNDTLLYDDPFVDGCYLDYYVGLENEENAGAAIFPNPAGPTVYISVNGPGSCGPFTYSILDLQGIRRMQGLLPDEKELDISVLPAGMYLLSVTDEQTGNILSARLLKTD